MGATENYRGVKLENEKAVPEYPPAPWQKVTNHWVRSEFLQI